MQTIQTIDLSDANRAAAACIGAAQTRGVAISVAVVDAAGHILRVDRMDGAKGYTMDLAVRKARTAVALSVPTSVLAATLNGRPLRSAEFVAVPGGSPVQTGLACAGAIGVSGARPEDNDVVLAAGVAAVG